MGKLLDLLKAATGEGSFTGRLGQWRQAVSAALDGSIPVLRNPAYVLANRITTVQSFAANGDIVLNNVAASDAGDIGLAYNPATGVYTLPAGILYELEFLGQWENFGTDATDIVTYEWVDAGTNAPLIANTGARGAPLDSTLDIAPQLVTKILYRPLALQTVKLRVTAITGSCDLRIAANASVRQLSSL